MFRLIERQRTPLWIPFYAVYMYFQGLSLRAVPACLEDFCPRSYVSVWCRVQRFGYLKNFSALGHVRCLLADETWLRVGSQEAWLWLAFDPHGRFFLGFYLSRTRNILVAELFLQGLIDRYGRHPVYSDGANWYPDVCRSLGLEHRIYDYLRSNLMERFIQYVKDRTECFDDYFPCRKEHCRLDHVKGWLNYFMLSFNLFKRSEILTQTPILTLQRFILEAKDPP